MRSCLDTPGTELRQCYFVFVLCMLPPPGRHAEVGRTSGTTGGASLLSSWLSGDSPTGETSVRSSRERVTGPPGRETRAFRLHALFSARGSAPSVCGRRCTTMCVRV